MKVGWYDDDHNTESYYDYDYYIAFADGLQMDWTAKNDNPEYPNVLYRDTETDVIIFDDEVNEYMLFESLYAIYLCSNKKEIPLEVQQYLALRAF